MHVRSVKAALSISKTDVTLAPLIVLPVKLKSFMVRLILIALIVWMDTLLDFGTTITDVSNKTVYQYCVFVMLENVSPARKAVAK
jgi:Na+/H+-dicarboxylate symporter